jgi:epoxyqueuosine reductase QueG
VKKKKKEKQEKENRLYKMSEWEYGCGPCIAECELFRARFSA